jgi:hypothetical protein
MWSLMFTGPITVVECVVALLLVVLFVLLGKYIARPTEQPIPVLPTTTDESFEIRLNRTRLLLDCYRMNWTPLWTAEYLGASMEEVVWVYVHLDEMYEFEDHTYRTRSK